MAGLFANGNAVAHWRSCAGSVSTNGFLNGSGCGTLNSAWCVDTLLLEKKSNMMT
jgi:hypothetical protein